MASNAFPTEFAPPKQLAPTSEQHSPNFYKFEQGSVTWKHSVHILLALQVFLLILYARCSQFSLLTAEAPGGVTTGYFYFGGIEIMM